MNCHHARKIHFLNPRGRNRELLVYCTRPQGHDGPHSNDDEDIEWT